MVKAILIVVVVAIAGVLTFAATRPDSFSVQRSTVIQAPPEKIYAVLEDFRRWPEWSPYEKKDPAMKRTLSGAEKGKGAVYAWEGNKDVGRGRMEIIEATPSANLKVQLEFFVPMEARNVAEFALAPKGTGTEVTWSMRGPMPFLNKVICVFLDMDKLVGTDFEAGLATLKALAEK